MTSQDSLPLHIFQQKCIASNIHNDLINSIIYVDFLNPEAYQELQKVLKGLVLLLDKGRIGECIEYHEIWSLIAANSGVELFNKFARVFNEDAEIAGPSQLDQQSILNLCQLYLADIPECLENLKIVIRLVCHDEKTCQFVIWCLLVMVEKSAGLADLKECIPSWLPSGSISTNVKICTNVIEVLSNIGASHADQFFRRPMNFEFGAKDFTTEISENLDEAFLHSFLGILGTEMISKNEDLTQKILSTTCGIVDNMSTDNIDKKILSQLLSKLLEFLHITNARKTSFDLLVSTEKLLSALSFGNYDRKFVTDKLIGIAENNRQVFNDFLRFNNQGEIFLLFAKFPHMLDFDVKIGNLDRSLIEINERSKVELAMECFGKIESSESGITELFKALELIFQSLADDNYDIEPMVERVISCAKQHAKHFNSFARNFDSTQLIPIVMPIEELLDFDVQIKYTSVVMTNMPEPLLIQFLSECIYHLDAEKNRKFQSKILTTLELLFKALYLSEYEMDNVNLSLKEFLDDHKQPINSLLLKFKKELGWLIQVFKPYSDWLDVKVQIENIDEILNNFDGRSKRKLLERCLNSYNRRNQIPGLVSTTKKLMRDFRTEDENEFVEFIMTHRTIVNSVLLKTNQPWMYTFLTPYPQFLSFDAKVQYYQETITYLDIPELLEILSECINRIAARTPISLPYKAFKKLADFTEVLFWLISNCDDCVYIDSFLKLAESHRTEINMILRREDTDIRQTIFDALVNFPTLVDFDVKMAFFDRAVLVMDQKSMLTLLSECLTLFPKAPTLELSQVIIQLSYYIDNNSDQLYNAAKHHQWAVNQVLRMHSGTPFSAPLCAIFIKYAYFVDTDNKYNYFMAGTVELDLLQLTILLNECVTLLEFSQTEQNIIEYITYVETMLKSLGSEPSQDIKSRLIKFAGQHRDLFNLKLREQQPKDQPGDMKNGPLIKLIEILVDEPGLVDFDIQLHHLPVLITTKDEKFLWQLTKQCFWKFEEEYGDDMQKTIETSIILLLNSLPHVLETFAEFMACNKKQINFFLLCYDGIAVFIYFVNFLHHLDLEVKAKYAISDHERMLPRMNEKILIDFLVHLTTNPTEETIRKVLPATEALLTHLSKFSVLTIYKNRLLDFAINNSIALNTVLCEKDGGFLKGSILEILEPVMYIFNDEVKVRYYSKFVQYMDTPAIQKLLPCCLNMLATFPYSPKILETLVAVKNIMDTIEEVAENREKCRRFELADLHKEQINRILARLDIPEAEPVYQFIAPFPDLLEFPVKMKYIEQLVVDREKNFLIDLLSECVTNSDPSAFNSSNEVYLGITLSIKHGIKTICEALTKKEVAGKNHQKILEFALKHRDFINYVFGSQNTGLEKSLFLLIAPYPDLCGFELKIKYLDYFLKTHNKKLHWELLSECLDRHAQHVISPVVTTPLHSLSRLFNSVAPKGSRLPLDLDWHLRFTRKHKDILNLLLTDAKLGCMKSIAKVMSFFPQFLTFANKIRYLRIIIKEMKYDASINLLTECLENLKFGVKEESWIRTLTSGVETLLLHITESPEVDNDELMAIADTYETQFLQVAQAFDHGTSHEFIAILIKLNPYLVGFEGRVLYLRKKLRSDSEANSQLDELGLTIRRENIFEDSYQATSQMHAEEWKERLRITFAHEHGLDGGGLLREWFTILTREIFNPNYALFTTAPGDRNSYMINKSSHVNPEHLDYFKFVGRFIGKSIFDSQYVDCHFTKAFYKHILDIPVVFEDFESEDPIFFNSLKTLLNHPISELGLDLTFSTDIEEFGVVSEKELKENGRNIVVTDENKQEYVELVYHLKMTGSVRQQLDAFKSGFYDVIGKELISHFNEKELELLICGQSNIDIDDLRRNTEYEKWREHDETIQWFWEALDSFDYVDKQRFLQFVTGSCKAPILGFAAHRKTLARDRPVLRITLESSGPDRLPRAHTCFNQLDLPEYTTYDNLKFSLLTAIREGNEGYEFS